MQNHKRTENRPPRPPVPKFRLIGAGTDTPDFLPPPKSEESSLNALSQDNTCETSNEESHESYFAHKRLQAIKEEMTNQIQQLGLSEDLLKTGFKILKPELLEELKSKKYNAIAVAILIVALRQTCVPITLKEILARTTISEKQIKKIVFKVQCQFKLDSTIQSFIKSISNQLGLNDNFSTFCNQILQFIITKDLIKGEHENTIAAAIVKLAGDIIFAERGGIIASIITDHAKCSTGTMCQFLKKIENSRRELYHHLKL